MRVVDLSNTVIHEFHLVNILLFKLQITVKGDLSPLIWYE